MQSSRCIRNTLTTGIYTVLWPAEETVLNTSHAGSVFVKVCLARATHFSSHAAEEQKLEAMQQEAHRQLQKLFAQTPNGTGSLTRRRDRARPASKTARVQTQFTTSQGARSSATGLKCTKVQNNELCHLLWSNIMDRC